MVNVWFKPNSATWPKVVSFLLNYITMNPFVEPFGNLTFVHLTVKMSNFDNVSSIHK